ncbi:hypothetical protein FB446DRAFT_790942 [Lentinula raphanica]|nr:hypothetical protein FB446DRAFT_790942 [Lentinula raphanica]
MDGISDTITLLGHDHTNIPWTRNSLEAQSPTGIPTAGSLPLYATYNPSSSSLSRPFILPDSVKPSNHLSLSQTHDYIRGTSFIDPSLEIPNEYLPPLAADETKYTRNLYLLDDPTNAGLKKKVLLCTSSAYGFVYTTIRRADTHPSFELKSGSTYGAVNVKIPRSFRGPVTGTTVHGSIVMSNTVSSQAMVFSDVLGVKQMFIGDMSTRNEGIDDTLFLESTHGNIRIYFKDEDLTSPIVKSMKSIWSGMFGG